MSNKDDKDERAVARGCLIFVIVLVAIPILVIWLFRSQIVAMLGG